LTLRLFLVLLLCRFVLLVRLTMVFTHLPFSLSLKTWSFGPPARRPYGSESQGRGSWLCREKGRQEYRIQETEFRIRYSPSAQPENIKCVAAKRHHSILTPYMKLHQVKSEPQNRRISNIECRRVGSLRSVIFYKTDRIPYFDIRYSLF
jgi:hypothetical protein